MIHGYGDFIRQLSPIKRAYKSNQVNISVTAYFPSLRTCQAFKNIFNTSQGIYYAPVIYPKLLTKRCAHTRPEFNKSGHKIGYFGRIEQSKNLIETIMLLDKNNFFNTGELFVAGEIDLHHYHFSQKHKDSNFLLRLTHFINDLDSRTKSKIHFIGNLNSNELAYFIKKMNIIINLSTFYGECFGISVRQALDLKTPVIASNWGGFHDIQNNSLVELIPISPGKSGVRKFSSSHFSKALRKLLLLPHKTMKARTEKKSRFLKSPKIFVLSNFTVPDEKKWKAFMAGID